MRKEPYKFAPGTGRGVAVILGIVFLGMVFAPPAPDNTPPVEDDVSSASEAAPVVEEENTPVSEAVPAVEENTPEVGGEGWIAEKDGWRVSSEGVPGQAEVIRSGETATLKVYAYLPGEYTESGEPLLAPDGSKLTWHLAEGSVHFGEGIATSTDGIFELEITATSNTDYNPDMWIGSLRLPGNLEADPSLDYEIIYEAPQFGDEWKLETFLDH